jgi:YggT family protein
MIRKVFIMTYSSDPIDPNDPDEERVIITEEPTEVRDTVVEESVVARRDPAILITRLIWLVLGFIEAFIALRIILRLLGADPANAFASLIYNVSALFVWPFVGLIQDPAFNGSTFEVTSIIAMFVYLLAAWGLVELVWVLTRPAGERYRVRERRIRRR